jgi:hypothetical protein
MLWNLALWLQGHFHSQWRFNMSLPVTANVQAVSHANPKALPQGNSPSKAARDYLAANPDSPAAESPFGKLVMQIARGISPGT